jgi:hypothetical protein
VLPQDVGYTSCSIFLRVKEPKTRFKAARHQMSKLDAEDLVQLVSLAFGSKRADEKLWPFSGQLLRTRFRQILREIGLPYDSNGINRGLDLGSLRGGGATYLLMLTEDSELVRRRGRWIAPRTMEVYLQEIAATVYFPQLPSALKARVLALASAFPGLLARMQVLVKAKVPAESWHYFFQQNETDGNVGKSWEEVVARHTRATQRGQTQNMAGVKEALEQLDAAENATMNDWRSS